MPPGICLGLGLDLTWAWFGGASGGGLAAASDVVLAQRDLRRCCWLAASDVLVAGGRLFKDHPHLLRNLADANNDGMVATSMSGVLSDAESERVSPTHGHKHTWTHARALFDNTGTDAEADEDEGMLGIPRSDREAVADTETVASQTCSHRHAAADAETLTC